VKSAIFGGEKPSAVVWRSLNNNLKELVEVEVNIKSEGLQRIGEVPQYQADPIVRRAPSLQKTKYNQPPSARIHPQMMEKLGLAEGDRVLVRQGEGSAELTVKADSHVAMGCVRIQAAHRLTACLGELMGDITVEKLQADTAVTA
jgi:NADH-quinone oxidoreductase subunit G